MATEPHTEPMPVEQSAALAEFARACKAAARAVSLYPGTHPAIGSSLRRLTATAARLVAGSGLTLTVHPDQLAIDGRTAARPDPAMGELAALLHERLIGTLQIARDADVDDWRALLLLLARSTEDLVAAGGISKAWAETGRDHFAIREIDYAEVLRERAGGDAAVWNRIVAYCLQGNTDTLDERAIAAIVEAFSDSAQFARLLERLQQDEALGASLGARAAALLKLLRIAVDAVGAAGTDGIHPVLQTVAGGAARLTPELMLGLLAHRDGGTPQDAALVNALVDTMSDGSIAAFVASSVAEQHGATARLAQAFEALVPDAGRKPRLLALAHDEAAATPFGKEEGFEELWQSASSMLMSYSDANYVSDDYARELSGARTQAIQVERVADDPPERVQGWLATVADQSLRELDLALLLDLLHIEQNPGEWRTLAALVAADVERRTALGDTDGALRLSAAVVARLAEPTGPELQEAAREAVDRLAAGALVRHVVLNLRKVEDPEVPAIVQLCHTIGPVLVRPLAEALAVEENTRAIRRLRELLLGFGAAGRQSVEQLKTSSNPSVRRTAIDLLRVFGGHEALAELASMLDDSDSQVQRESIRAIVQIGTPQAYAVLERTLVAGGRSRETVVRELIALRDDKAIPLLCYVLDHTHPRGAMAQAHADIMDVLGGLGAHPDSTRTLRQALYAGRWWAPLRTAALRRAAAAALRRIGTSDAVAVLDEAIARGPRGVRLAARTARAKERG